VGATFVAAPRGDLPSPSGTIDAGTSDGDRKTAHIVIATVTSRPPAAGPTQRRDVVETGVSTSARIIPLIGPSAAKGARHLGQREAPSTEGAPQEAQCTRGIVI